jgi:hypothetical protein
MVQREFLLRVIDTLEQLNIPYAITGAWAVSAYGIPRTTHDLDVIVRMQRSDVHLLAAAYPPPYYADEEMMHNALTHGSVFNIIDPTTGLKVDFWPLRDDAYAREQFSRRRQVEIAGRNVWVLAPEDVILSKLLWYKLSPSDKQWADIQAVWEARDEHFDANYLENWAVRLSVADLLEKAKES